MDANAGTGGISVSIRIMCLAAASAAAGLARAADYAVDGYVIGPGGVSTGGVYRMQGAAGQPDAGEAMSGGRFAVVGGAYAQVAPRRSATVLHSVDLVVSSAGAVVT